MSGLACEPEQLYATMRCLPAQELLLLAVEKRSDEDIDLAVASLLENFDQLTPEMKRSVIRALKPNVVKAIQNDALLDLATADVPRAEDGIFATALKTGRPVRGV